jgi:hypothetical protein
MQRKNQSAAAKNAPTKWGEKKKQIHANIRARSRVERLCPADNHWRPSMEWGCGPNRYRADVKLDLPLDRFCCIWVNATKKCSGTGVLQVREIMLRYTDINSSPAAGFTAVVCLRWEEGVCVRNLKRKTPRIQIARPRVEGVSPQIAADWRMKRGRGPTAILIYESASALTIMYQIPYKLAHRWAVCRSKRTVNFPDRN